MKLQAVLMYTTILPSDNQWYFNMNIESGEKMT